MDNLIKRITNLLSIKSIVTLVLTAVFAYLSLYGEVNRDFLTIYTVVISFYFGSQSVKKEG